MFEGNDGKQGVAREGEVQSGVGSAMPVTIFLPGRGVSFVVVAVLNAPVTSDGFCGTGFFVHRQAGEEDTGVALGGLRVFFFAPVALHGNGATGSGESSRYRRDGLDGGFAGIDAPVLPFATELKKGEPSRASAAPLRRLEVFAFVPMR